MPQGQTLRYRLGRVEGQVPLKVHQTLGTDRPTFDISIAYTPTHHASCQLSACIVHPTRIFVSLTAACSLTTDCIPFFLLGTHTLHHIYCSRVHIRSIHPYPSHAGHTREKLDTPCSYAHSIQVIYKRKHNNNADDCTEQEQPEQEVCV
jgi:hypothetical protein